MFSSADMVTVSVIVCHIGMAAYCTCFGIKWLLFVVYQAFTCLNAEVLNGSGFGVVGFLWLKVWILSKYGNA